MRVDSQRMVLSIFLCRKALMKSLDIELTTVTFFFISRENVRVAICAVPSLWLYRHWREWFLCVPRWASDGQFIVALLLKDVFHWYFALLSILFYLGAISVHRVLFVDFIRCHTTIDYCWNNNGINVRKE